MSHLGIICPCVFGHFNPMATLGRELIRRGHRVTFLGFVDLREQVLDAGLAFAPIGEQDFPAGSLRETIESLGRLNGAEARRYTVDWYRRIYSTVLREGPSAMRSLNLDGHITDQTTICSAAVAELLEIPCVSVANALLYEQHPDVPPAFTGWRFHSTWWTRLRNRIGYWALNREVRPVFDLLYQYRRQWNLKVESNPTAVYRLLATISQQPPGFEFPRSDLHSAFHFTGPLRDERSHYEVEFPFDRLNGRPLVYASMGTLQNRVPDVFRRVAHACADLDVQLVMSAGGTTDGLDNLPGDPIVVEFAPQLELIRKAALVITHAGMNTTIDALSNGVPMVAIPVTNEQPAIAARIAYRNCGRVVPFRKLTAPRLKAAVEIVLRDPTYREAAQAMRRNAESGGGVRRAADIVEQAISTGRPVHNGQRSQVPADNGFSRRVA